MRCKSHEVLVKHVSDVVDFKGLTLEVDGLAQTACRTCGLTWTTDGQDQDNFAILKAAFAAKRDEVRNREGLLTGEDIGYVLDELGMTKAAAASLFGGGPNAFSKYMTGDVLQSFAMDRLLRLTMAFGDQAVRYLALGRDAPLKLHAGGFFVAPAVSESTSVELAAVGRIGDLQMMDASTSSQELTVAA